MEPLGKNTANNKKTQRVWSVQEQASPAEAIKVQRTPRSLISVPGCRARTLRWWSLPPRISSDVSALAEVCGPGGNMQTLSFSSTRQLLHFFQWTEWFQRQMHTCQPLVYDWTMVVALLMFRYFFCCCEMEKCHYASVSMVFNPLCILV